MTTSIWRTVTYCRKDIDLRPVEGVNGSCTEQVILEKLAKFGITPEAVTLWGTGTPMREFLWSEEMADASVHVLLNVDFKDICAGKGEEIRNCHINIGTGKEISIREAAEMIIREVGFRGELRWDRSGRNPAQTDGRNPSACPGMAPPHRNRRRHSSPL